MRAAESAQTVPEKEAMLRKALTLAVSDEENKEALNALAVLCRGIGLTDDAEHFEDEALAFSLARNFKHDVAYSRLPVGSDKSVVFSGSLSIIPDTPRNIAVSSAVVSDNSETCEFCLRSFCLSNCREKHSELIAFETTISSIVKFAEEHSGVKPQLLGLTIRELFKSDVPHLLAYLPLSTPDPQIASAAALLAPAFNGRLRESLIAKAIFGIRAQSLEMPIHSGGKVLLFIPRLDLFVRHSCAPNSECYLGTDGLLWSTSVSDDPPTADLSFGLISLPRAYRWRHFENLKGWDSCNCQRCGDRNGDSLIQGVNCFSCRDGICLYEADDEWKCGGCGILSVRPGKILAECVGVYEDIAGDKNALCLRANLTTLLDRINACLSPDHWLRFRVLSDLVDSLTLEPCPDLPRAELCGRQLLALLGGGIPAYSNRALLIDLTSKLVAPAALNASLLCPPGGATFMKSIEDAIVPLVGLITPPLPSAPWNRRVIELIKSHAELCIPIALQFHKESLAFHPALWKDLLLARLAKLAAAGDLPEFRRLFETNTPLLHGSVNWLFISNQKPLLCAAVEARQDGVVKELLMSYGADAMLTNYFGWSAIFSAVVANKLDQSSIEAQVRQGVILKQLIKSSGKEFLLTHRLDDISGGETLLHLVTQARIAKILLDSGADPRLKNRTGLTPIDVAVKTCNSEMIELYVTRGLLII